MTTKEGNKELDQAVRTRYWCGFVLLVGLAVVLALIIGSSFEAKVEEVERKGLLMDRLQDEVEHLRELLPMQGSESSGDMPLRIMEGEENTENPPKVLPVSPMSFKVGEWTETPWPGLSCFGISLTESEVVVICEVLEPVRLEPHTHGPWDETVIMFEGVLYGHVSDTFYPAGGEPYFAPSGMVHEPEFMTPARCIITWRRIDP